MYVTITLISAVITAGELDTPLSPLPPKPVIATEPLSASEQVTPQLTARLGSRGEKRVYSRWCGENCHVIPFNQGLGRRPLSLPFYLWTHAHSHGVLRRPGLPRVICSPGAPVHATTIHSFHSARAARASGTRKSAGRGDALNRSIGSSSGAGGGYLPWRAAFGPVTETSAR